MAELRARSRGDALLTLERHAEFQRVAVEDVVVVKELKSNAFVIELDVVVVQLDGGTRDVEHRDEDEQPSSAEMHAGHLLPITRRAFERSVVERVGRRALRAVADVEEGRLACVASARRSSVRCGALRCRCARRALRGPSEGPRRIVNPASENGFSSEGWARLDYCAGHCPFGALCLSRRGAQSAPRSLPWHAPALRFGPLGYREPRTGPLEAQAPKVPRSRTHGLPRCSFRTSPRALPGGRRAEPVGRSVARLSAQPIDYAPEAPSWCAPALAAWACPACPCWP